MYQYYTLFRKIITNTTAYADESNNNNDDNNTYNNNNNNNVKNIDISINNEKDYIPLTTPIKSHKTAVKKMSSMFSTPTYVYNTALPTYQQQDYYTTPPNKTHYNTTAATPKTPPPFTSKTTSPPKTLPTTTQNTPTTTNSTFPADKPADGENKKNTKTKTTPPKETVVSRKQHILGMLTKQKDITN